MGQMGLKSSKLFILFCNIPVSLGLWPKARWLMKIGGVRFSFLLSLSPRLADGLPEDVDTLQSLHTPNII
jgi:hypothetical protein